MNDRPPEAWLNPKFGDDATAVVGDRFHPFKSPKAMQEALEKICDKKTQVKVHFSLKPVPVPQKKGDDE